jgi:hypothetical protein
MLHAIAVVALLIGVVFILAGHLAFIVQAFRTNILWGLGVLFLPVVPLVFLIVEWARVKRFFFWELYGIALVVAAVIVSPNSFPSH